MKNMKRLLSLLLCLCMMLGALVTLTSCFGNGDDKLDESGSTDNGGAQQPGDPTESESETEPEKFYSLNLTENGTTQYVIIYPTKTKDYTDEMRTAVDQLIQALKVYTGAEIVSKNDYMGYDENYNDILPDENAYEILIGKTNRHQSADAIEDLGFGEYVIKADGNKLVINGTDNDAIVEAIKYFTLNKIKGNKDLGYNKKDATFVFTTDDNYKKGSSYQIKTITIGDKKISDMKIVYPNGDMVAKYVATLIKKHIVTFSGVNLSVLADNDPKVGNSPAIHVGKTAQSTATAADGKYLIEVTSTGLEIAVKDMFSYAAVYTKIVNDVIAYSNPHVKLEAGQKWEEDSIQEANAERTTDVRVMYHNVWGYMISADQIAKGSLPNPVSAPNANRYAIANEVYKAYAPDAIGFQEMNTDRAVIEEWLYLNGYSKVGGSHYDHHPIWYKASVLQVVASGTNKGWSHYHSNWVIFKVKATGKTFGMTNSHFTANSMVSQTEPDMVPQLGDEARTIDAQALLKSVADCKAAGGENMPIITGGDYNCNFESGAYATMINGGLTNVRDLADKSADISCHHGVSYDEDFGMYKLPTKVSSSVTSAIDHIMVNDAANAPIDVKEYAVIGDRMTAVSSDHAPHFVDFNFN